MNIKSSKEEVRPRAKNIDIFLYDKYDIMDGKVKYTGSF